MWLLTPLHEGYHPRGQRVRMPLLQYRGEYSTLLFSCFVAFVPQRRKDLAHEPICEQAIQQSIQGNHWRRLVSIPCARGSMTSDGKACLHSLTKEVMVDDRLVTMQVCVTLFTQECLLMRVCLHFSALGYGWSGALPVARRRVLSWSRLLRPRLRCEQCQVF